MAYFAPYIDASGIHMPTYEDRMAAGEADLGQMEKRVRGGTRSGKKRGGG